MLRHLGSRFAGTFLAALAFSLLSGETVEAQVQDLLVSDVGSNSIKRFNGATGAFMGTFASGGGLFVPFGLSYGPDNNLYVSSLGSGDILRYNGASGAFIDRYVAKGVGGLVYPNQLAFSPVTGDLYVASYTLNSVLRFQGPNGSSPGAFVSNFASGGGLQGPTGIVFGPDGNLYVNSSSTNQVFRYDGTTGALIGGGAFINGTTANLNAPAGLSFGPDGNLYDTSFFGNTPNVARFDATTGAFINIFASGGGLNGPVLPLFGNDLKLYVSSYESDSILRYNAETGTFIDTFISTNLDMPTYMTFIPVGGGGGSLTAVPEPSSTALLGLGAIGLAVTHRRRRRA